MSKDHKPEDEIEIARIKKAGCRISSDGRINGNLNLTRALGKYLYFKPKIIINGAVIDPAPLGYEVVLFNISH